MVCIEENKIIGFGNIDDKGYLDFLYTHCDYQNMGVATGICNELENYTRKDIYTYASITARKFFENRGYKVVRENEVIRRGIVLKNYLMRKSR